MRLWGSSSIHALRLAVCFAPEGEGDGEPLSYDQQIQADVAASVAEVEAKIPAAGQGDGAAERSDGLAARDASAADPAAQPTEAKADAQGRLRGPDGKFAPKSGDNQQRVPHPPPAHVDPAAQPQAAADPQQQAAAAASVAQPPSSWAIGAKAEWDALPALVKEAIAKREQEMGQGLAALRDYKDLKPYAEMAQQSGTTLSAALEKYVTIEQVMRSNPAQGFMEAAKNLGMTKAQAAQSFLQLAQHLGAQVPAHQSGGRQGESDQNDDPLMEVLQPLIHRSVAPLQQRNEALEAQLAELMGVHQQTAADQAFGVLQDMAAKPEYRFLAELEADIAHLFNTGAVRRTGNHQADIGKAYRMAAAAHPEISALQSNARATETAEQRAAREADKTAKALKASRSITGSASDGAAPVGKQKRRDGMSYDQDLAADVRAAAGLPN